MNARPLWGSVVLYFFAALIVVISVYPFLYTVATSLKSGTELFSTSLMPDNPSLNNYITLFKGKQPFGTQLWNSVMVATTTVAISMFMAITASYALGRIAFKGKGALLLTILAVSMFPQVAVLSGMFELMQSLGLYNRTLGLVVPYTVFTLPFTVWMLTTFMRGMPKELEEAATCLGASPFQTFIKVILPTITPALLTGFAMAFARAIGEYGSVIFIAGNMPMVSEITSLIIIGKLEQYDFAGATAVAVVMLVGSFILLMIINLLQAWQRKRAGMKS
jgi:trehalose/maltose transport system permease protein